MIVERDIPTFNMPKHIHVHLDFNEKTQRIYYYVVQNICGIECFTWNIARHSVLLTHFQPKYTGY